MFEDVISVPPSGEQLVEQEPQISEGRTEVRNEGLQRVRGDEMKTAAEEASGERSRWDGNFDCLKKYYQTEARKSPVVKVVRKRPATYRARGAEGRAGVTLGL